MSGPKLSACDAVHAMKYRAVGESHREMTNRVAAALQDDHEHYMYFRRLLMDMSFLPAGRIQAAVGSTKSITPYNCFVSATIADSFVDGPDSIMDVAKQAATTMRQGGGIGYDFSTLRPSGDAIRGVGGTTDGPLAFARIFNEVCRATSSSGNRRGAQMGVLRIDHPDVEQFIHAKQNQDQFTGFNFSIAITDYFMECLREGRPFPLSYGGKEYRTVDPAALWEMVMRSTYDWAEPGVLFIDRINALNNLWYCETIAATNPCGEQPLPPHGACLLGSFNLVRYVDLHENKIDLERLRADCMPVLRSMDNVVDRARYPLPEQRAEAQSKRRVGIGITGLANALEAIGHVYGSPSFLEATDTIMAELKNALYMASAALAAEKGPFPLYEADKYLAGQFVQGLDDEVVDAVAANGIRNSHLVSVAPTGTISFCADNVSSGGEPVFSYVTNRLMRVEGGEKVVEIDDFGVREFGVRGKTAAEVTPDEHVAVLAVIQKHVDSGVSKTCNLPKDIGWDEFKEVYLSAYRLGAKGCTTYRSGGMREAVLTAVSETAEEDEAACRFDPATGTRTCDE